MLVQPYEHSIIDCASVCPVIGSRGVQNEFDQLGQALGELLWRARTLKGDAAAHIQRHERVCAVFRERVESGQAHTFDSMERERGEAMAATCER